MAQNKSPGLVVFDVEGVLLPKKRYLFFEVGRNLKFREFLRIIFYGFLYELGLVSLKSAFTQVFKTFKGIRVDELLRIFKQVPLMSGCEEVFEELRNEGWKTALISSGLPIIVVHDLANRLKADYAYGFELGVKDGLVTGEIGGDVIEHNGKLRVLKKILETEKLAPKDCVVVADDRNNMSIFLPGMLKIGYDADFAIRVKSDIVVNGKLHEILAPIQGKPKEREALNLNEILRETIHASGFSVPIVCIYLGLPIIALAILIIMLLYLMSELARMERKKLSILSSITLSAATQYELYEFATAPIFFALGILLTLILFPFAASSAAIAIFALGDSTASIFGRIYGRDILPFNKGKTLEGSVFGFVFAFLAGSVFTVPLKSLIGALIAMTVESLPLPVNDNFITPLITGAALTLML
ncbi:MAG TPA: haloacid dehalogenase-like hydrolase [Candidatus Bathyarchaeia archaeon]|nr:haloacid dehalogenase-like hydrolase [Candidatus Bathyarchaeia archaeon]